MMRFDSAIARQSVIQAQIGKMTINGRPMQIEDFMPYGKEEEPEASVDDLAAVLGAKQAHG